MALVPAASSDILASWIEGDRMGFDRKGSRASATAPFHQMMNNDERISIFVLVNSTITSLLVLT
uniref:Uncharacterized protein n=1 Tax=Rhizobium rhizogenes TaxID=359 RepID=A0A7S4ZT49_RHIRH|nr:hypothetical protein pC6.5c_517 [Rhizobium rhizogenes]QCO89376.1 hypothetical protein pC5.7d_660 [Rhizobium rhizogenes]